MPAPMPRRRLALLLGLLLLTALFVRLGYQQQMSSSPLWQAPILDEAVNHQWALQVARGEGWGEIPFFRAPLYPWFLGLLYTALGESPGAARLVQAVLSSFTCLLVWWVARRTFSPLAGWCAGLLAATYWPWVYFDAELQDVPLALFWNLAALALLVTWTPRRRHTWLPAAAGLLLGLSAITRPTVLVVLPAVAGWLWWQGRCGDEGRAASRPSWAAPLLLALGVLMAVLPVTALNRMVGGDSVLVASQGGMNFYMGNHADSDGHSARLPGARADWLSLRNESRRQAESARGTTLRASEVSDYWYGRGLEFWRRSPALALQLTARKAGYLAGAAELPNNKQIRFLIERYAPAWRLPWPGFSLVAPLGLVGLWWGGGGRRSVLLGAFALSYGAAVVAFFVTARFRMPVMAVWIILAGGGVAALWHLVRRGSRRSLLAAAGTFLLVAVLVQLPARGHQENAAHGHYTLARAHGQRGQSVQAEEEYRQALALQPAFAEAVLGWSALLLQDSRADETLPVLRRAVVAHPEDLLLVANLALALQRVGRAQESVTLLQERLSRRPEQADLWLWLGNAQQQAARPGDAMASYQRVLDLEPVRADALYNLANAQVSVGQVEEGVRTYRALLAQHPDHHGGWTMLAIALSGRGDLDGAVDAFETVVQLQPRSVRAHVNLGHALRRQGDTRAAALQFRRAKELDPEAEVRQQPVEGSSPGC